MSRTADQDVERRDPPVLMGDTADDGRPLRWFKSSPIAVTHACRACNAFHEHNEPCGEDTWDLRDVVVRPDAADLEECREIVAETLAMDVTGGVG